MYILKRLDTEQYYTQSHQARDFWTRDIDLSKVYLSSSPAMTKMRELGSFQEYPMAVIEVSLEEV